MPLLQHYVLCTAKRPGQQALTVQALMAAASSQGMMESLQQASRTSVIGESSSSAVESWPACCSSRCFSWHEACSASSVSGRSLAFICTAGQPQLQLLTQAMTPVHTTTLYTLCHGRTLQLSFGALPCLLLRLPHKHYLTSMKSVLNYVQAEGGAQSGQRIVCRAP